MENRAETTAKRVDAFAAALTEGGLRLTHQRLEIIRELAKAKDHPDAETVLQRVRRRVPTLSPDTVYRTLDVLVRGGLVDRVLMPRATRFDPDRSPHHHFVCDNCGGVVDISSDTLEPFCPIPGVLDGVGDVRTVHVQVWGTCDACKG